MLKYFKYLFFGSRRYARVVAAIYGALIGLPSLTGAIVILAESHWTLPPPPQVLILIGLTIVGYKIGRRCSQSLAIAVASIFAVAIVAVYLKSPQDVGVIQTAWFALALSAYGAAATIVYVQLSGLNSEILQRMKTMVSVAAGTCCCLLLGLGAFSIYRSGHPRETLYALGIMALFVFAFFDPLLDYASEHFHLKRQNLVSKNGWFRFVGLFIFSALAAVLHKGLEQGLENAERTKGFVLILLLAMLVLPGQITGAWVNGARSRRSHWFGVSRGALVGLLSVLFIWTIVGNVQVEGNAVRPNFSAYLAHICEAAEAEGARAVYLHAGDVSSPPSTEWEDLAGATAVTWAFYGLLGGMAVVRRKGPRTMLLWLIACGIAVELTMWSLGQGSQDLIRFGVAQLCLEVGWVLGILLYPPAAHVLFGQSQSSTGPPPGQLRPSTTSLRVKDQHLQELGSARSSTGASS
jgi:hypothetical protein